MATGANKVLKGYPTVCTKEWCGQPYVIENWLYFVLKNGLLKVLFVAILYYICFFLCF